MNFRGNYAADTAFLRERLRVGRSLDVKEHRMIVGEREASLFFVDGLVNNSIVEKVLEKLLALTAEQLKETPDADAFIRRYVAYPGTRTQPETERFIREVMAGICGVIVDGFAAGILIEMREYPTRSIEEPENDRVLRGSHDGFSETLQCNVSLLRRRIRDPRLTVEHLCIGSRSQTDVALCYMDELADKTQVETLRRKLTAIDVPALTMSQESLAECLCRRQWYNPFPRTRYTERPDAAAASLSEGRILILVDNTAAAMILPTALWDFIQDTNDYCFPPLAGSYLRFVRSVVFFLTLVWTPVWYLLVCNPDWIPAWLGFIKIEELNQVPLLAQLLVIEALIDVLKLASLNTPTSLSNAFGLIGALILGEFAVNAKLFAAEVMLYMAFVAVGNFTQPSFELGYAFKMSRLLMLICISLWNLWGLIAGAGVTLLVAMTTRTPLGHYLYPVVPFNGKKLRRLLWRHPIDRENS